MEADLFAAEGVLGFLDQPLGLVGMAFGIMKGLQLFDSGFPGQQSRLTGGQMAPVPRPVFFFGNKRGFAKQEVCLAD